MNGIAPRERGRPRAKRPARPAASSGRRGRRRHAFLRAGAGPGRLLAGLLLCAAALWPALPAAGSDPEVEAAQRRLVALGYEPGAVDGVMGRRTRSALRAFQRARGLTPTGRVDDATRAALRLPAKAAPGPGTQAPGDAGAAAGGAARATTGGAERTTGGAARNATDDEGERGGALPEGVGGSVATDAPPVALIGYEALGWRPPATVEEVFARFLASRDAPIRERTNQSLIVPDGERIYLLDRGEHFPDLPCDPAAGAMRVDPMHFSGGPVLFTPLDEPGLCRLGRGVVLQSGRVLRFGRTQWPEGTWRAGRVRIDPEGLRYVSEP